MTTTTNKPGQQRRLPAEWEGDNAVLLSWPHANSDWAYMLDEVTECYRNLTEALARYATVVIVTPEPEKVEACLDSIEGLNRSNVLVASTPTNDTWIRDYGPITTIKTDGMPVLNDFKFNGWGLKFAADRDNLVTRHLIASGLFSNAMYANRLGFVLEGGAIESDGRGTLLTTSHCLLSPNRNGDLTRDEIEERLVHWFGLTRVLWLNHGQLTGDDTDGHVDTLARLAPNDTILYCGCSDTSHPDYEALDKMRMELKELRTAQGMPYNLIEMPLPDPIFDANDGSLLPATYANFLIVNNAVLVPSYNQERNDRLAREIVRIAFPDHEVVSVDCRALIRQHGSLHCATMQIPKSILPL